MSARFWAVLFYRTSVIFLTCIGSLAQSSSGRPAPRTSDTIFYLHFFRRVDRWHQGATTPGYQQKADVEALHQLSDTVHLKTAEEEALQSIAADCLSKEVVSRARVSAIESKNRIPFPEKARKQIVAVHEQERQMILDHIRQLENLLGPDRFQTLETYAQRLMRPQSAVTADSAPPVPDDILYEFFFGYVHTVQRAADRGAAAGVKNAEALHHIKNAAHLTPAEEVALKSITADFEGQFGAIQSKLHTLGEENRNNVPWPDAVREQVMALRQQQHQVTMDHIQQLQKAFGANRFQMLDDYVRRTILPTVRATPIPGGQ